ncbi:hypothetical protein PQQ63_15345 [Paraburkholderia metrosideri]|uniref:Uncharacterized protein n=1 Tax=Paraburkholderia metrosideri TaxID=580937 RepID=A0ABW9DVQ0_9BURK
MQRFPAWLYHPTEEPKIFHDVESHDEAIEAGWVDTPAKLVKPDAVDPDDTGSTEDKAALLAQAKELGIDAKGTWGVKKLQDAIAAELDRE